jgi:tetratricopeptide (TPR) repeat protein
MHDGFHELSGHAVRRMRGLRALSAGWLLLGLLLFSRSALAQATDAASDANRDASARVLFQEGVGLAEKGEWPAAEDRFRRALTLRASPVIAYNLASTLVERGKLIEASELLRKVEQDDKTDATMQRSVQSLQADLGKRIGRIRVGVLGKQPNDRVTLDGNALVDAQLDVDIPIDPGPHRLNFTRGIQQLDVRDLKIAPGASEQFTLQAQLAPTARQVAAASQTARPLAAPPMAAVPVNQNPNADSATASDGQPISSRWWFWTGIGAVGVAAVVVAVVVAGSSKATPEPAYQGTFTPASLRVPVVP